MITLNKKRNYIIYSLLGIITITLATISTINRVKKISTPPEVYELSKGDNNVDNYLEWKQLIKKHVANELYINVNGFWIDMEKNNIFSGSISCFAKNSSGMSYCSPTDNILHTQKKDKLNAIFILIMN